MEDHFRLRFRRQSNVTATLVSSCEKLLEFARDVGDGRTIPIINMGQAPWPLSIVRTTMRS